MSNLVIDIGNTRVKIALFKNEEQYESFVCEAEDLLLHLKKIITSNSIKRAILSSVIDLNEKLITFLKGHIEMFILLDEKTLLPVSNEYKTKETLGKDRIAGVVGANALYPGRNILVIDAGTAITYDFIDAENRYLGGNISLGIDMRFKALHDYTKKLPRIYKEDDYPLLGTNTKEAILSGVLSGVVYEIDAYIGKFRKEYPELLTFLTGGDAFFFDTKLKNRIFVSENLLMIGLNRILNYNV